jgi:hypothetical protein
MTILNNGTPYRIQGHFKDFDTEVAFPGAQEGDEVLIENETGIQTQRFIDGAWHGVHHEPHTKIPLWHIENKAE